MSSGLFVLTKFNKGKSLMLRFLKTKSDFLMDSEEFSHITGIGSDDLLRSVREIEYCRSHYELDDFRYEMTEVGALVLASIFRDRIKDSAAENLIRFIGLKKQQRYQAELVAITKRLLIGSTILGNAFLDLAKIEIPEGCDGFQKKELIELSSKYIFSEAYPNQHRRECQARAGAFADFIAPGS
jgi:hypothetical protein